SRGGSSARDRDRCAPCRAPVRPSPVRPRAGGSGDCRVSSRLRTPPLPRPSGAPCPKAQAAWGSRDANALYADEGERLLRPALDLETEGDGLLDTLHQFVERASLGVAPGQSRDGGHEEALLVLLDDDVELLLHGIILTGALHVGTRASADRMVS